MEKKMYLVRYYGGCYDDYYTVVLFVTSKKSTATKYVTKFNSTLNRWKKYYSKFEKTEHGFTWIKEEYAESHYGRWCDLRNITKCYYEEINVR